MSDWPASVPREEMLARVIRRGRYLRRLRMLAIAAATALVAAGGVVGYQLGTSGAVDLLAEGTIDAGGVPVEYHACPASGPAGRLHRGDRVLITGIDDGGDWVEVRSPVDPVERVWIPAAAVTPDAALEVPVRDECTLDDGTTVELAGGEVVTTTTTDTTVPAEDPTTTTDTTVPGADPTAPPTSTGPGPAPTTPGPTAPPTTPPPTPPKDTTGPTITDIQRTVSLIRDGAPSPNPEFCDTNAMTSDVSAVVTDPSGVASVRASWSFRSNGLPSGQLRSGSVALTFSGGRWRGTIGPFTAHDTVANYQTVDINWSVVATDTVGNTRTVAAGPNAQILIQGCND